VASTIENYLNDGIHSAEAKRIEMGCPWVGRVSIMQSTYGHKPEKQIAMKGTPGKWVGSMFRNARRALRIL
jgi:hypothetical protein